MKFPESDLEEVWEHLELLSRKRVVSGALEEFWAHKKTLSPMSLMKALFTEEVLARIRRELRRKSDVRLELTDIAASLRRLLNPEVLTEDIKIRKARKKRKRTVKPSVGKAEQTKDGNDTEGPD